MFNFDYIAEEDIKIMNQILMKFIYMLKIHTKKNINC